MSFCIDKLRNEIAIFVTDATISNQMKECWECFQLQCYCFGSNNIGKVASHSSLIAVSLSWCFTLDIYPTQFVLSSNHFECPCWQILCINSGFQLNFICQLAADVIDEISTNLRAQAVPTAYVNYLVDLPSKCKFQSEHLVVTERCHKGWRTSENNFASHGLIERCILISSKCFYDICWITKSICFN